MTKFEKVIKGLENCKEGGSCDGCQYDINFSKCIFLLHADALALLKEQQQKKSKEEVLLAIIGKQSYTDLEKFKQLEELNDEYFNGMLDSIRAVEKLFDDN